MTAKSALLVIDVQQGLCEGRWAAFEAQQRVIERPNALARAARSAGAPVIFVQHEEDDGLVHGSRAWQLADGLDAQHGDVRLRKRGSDAFHQTSLRETLQARGIERLVVCGLQSDFCVDSTVRRGLALGYAVTLVSDAHSTADSETLTAAQIIAHHNRTLGYLGSYGRRVTLSPASDVRFDR
jgi:nicotinamidase-related amidase